MILDRLENADRYAGLLPGLRQAFDFLRRQGPEGLAALTVGRCEIDGDRVFAIVARDIGRGHAASPLEAHRRYADVQYVLAGADEMGWRSLSECRSECRSERPFAPVRVGESGGTDGAAGADGTGGTGGALAGGEGTRSSYDAEKDIVFFDDAPETWFRVPAGSFAVFFPEDAHAPLAGEGEVRKVIVKVAVA
jgi:beta-galactosidase beta subunit